MQQAFVFAKAAPGPEAAAGPVVDYDFPAPADEWNGIVLVGEAPGAEETRLGRPFVGRSGQLLDRTLEKAGIERRRSLIANVFRMQPPGNKVDHFFISRRLAKQKGIEIAEEYGPFGSAWCLEEFSGEIRHLRRTLEKMRQERSKIIIVALGRTPLWALTGENGLMQKVGKAIACRLLPDTQVIPTFHPSFILRGNWALEKDWLDHFAAAKKYI